MTIIQKQKQLQFLGYYKGKIDGIWGAQSIAATKEFQKANDLSVDGVFGAKTEAKSIELIVAIQRIIGANVDGLVGSETISKYKLYQSKETQSDGDSWAQIKYFKRDEFRCKCGRYCDGFPVEPDQLLVQTADKVREHFGIPMRVSSGVRCSQHNADVGGVSGSRHKTGKAMDFCVTGRTANTVLNYVKKLPEIRYAYAIDGSYVHMDVE